MGGPMHSGAAQLPDASFAAGKVIDPSAVGSALKQLLARTEVSQAHALVAVSDSIATFRVLDVPLDETDQQITVAVAKELTLDPERIATRWVTVSTAEGRRRVYAAAWDRAALRACTDAVKHAGVDAVVDELKSAAIARTVQEPSCVVLDLVSNPAELVLLDRSTPHTWHSFPLANGAGDGLAETLVGPIQSVVRFHQRTPRSSFREDSPVLISAEQAVPQQAMNQLSALTGLPVRVLGQPPRVPPNVRHSTYLVCLGLIMRRSG